MRTGWLLPPDQTAAWLAWLAGERAAALGGISRRCATPPPADAYGLVLQHEQGWSLVYSGDTQPCQQLVQVW